MTVKTRIAKYIPYKLDKMISANAVYLRFPILSDILQLSNSRYDINFQGSWLSLANFIL